MLTQQTLEKLYTMKLNGMADAFRQQQEDTEIASLSFEERFGLLVDQQWIWKENRALARRLAGAKFKLSAAVEDIDFRHARGLDASCCAASPTSRVGCGSIRTFFC